MASKNSIKINLPQAYYHIYNRGVEKRTIFLDEQDYAVFLSYLQTYLSPKEEIQLLSILYSKDTSREEKDKTKKLLRLKNYTDTIDLLAHTLMPNHFHLLIYQSKNVLDAFMNSLGTRYVMYFNKKYNRKGVLFQDVYKAVRVQSDDQLLYVSKYIHLNGPEALNLPPHRYKESKFPCSLPEYIGGKQTLWIKKHHILDFFKGANPSESYKNFVFGDSNFEDFKDELIDYED